MNCNTCNLQITSGFLCTVCDNFKLCMCCYDKKEHSHEMQSFPTDELTRDPPQNILENSELPITRYVRMLFRAYRNQEGNYRATFASLSEHIMTTNLFCSCIICKQMFLIYKYHSKKCQTPRCRVSQCPVINDRQLKMRLAAFNTQDIEKKLLKGRTAKANVQVSTDPSNPISVKLLARKFMIQRCIRTLVHACQCLEPDCMPVSCKKMKRVLAHIKVCQRRIKGGCTVCTQLSTLCCFHAHTCKETKCPVLLCSTIKRKMQWANKQNA